MRSLRDYTRALQYFVNYIFFEKTRGLDFSLRDLSQISDEQQHGYAMTSDMALRNISTIIPFEGKKFLDIGSGKGRVPFQAVMLGSSMAEGVEFSEKFHRIAENNYKILGIDNKCRSNRIAAEKFNRYDEFDIFFLFNPFEDELYELVIDTLMEQLSSHSKDRHLVCYGGANLDAVEKYPGVENIYLGKCPHRANRVAIYKL